jgi:hypothetical protein
MHSPQAQRGQRRFDENLRGEPRSQLVTSVLPWKADTCPRGALPHGPSHEIRWQMHEQSRVSRKQSHLTLGVHVRKGGRDEHTHDLGQVNVCGGSISDTHAHTHTHTHTHTYIHTHTYTHMHRPATRCGWTSQACGAARPPLSCRGDRPSSTPRPPAALCRLSDTCACACVRVRERG